MITACIDDLAIFGGPPEFQEKLHVGKPNFGDAQQLFRRLRRIVDTGWLTNGGPFVQEFEGEIASTVGVKHCVSTCNGTIALEIAIRGLDLHGEVILPAYTFVATAHALQWQRITPIFCDINANYQIDPQQIEALITPRTTGILGVHLWGRPCDVEKLTAIAQRHRLRLLFDASHAFGVTHGNEMIGRFGDAEVFSFHATKFVNAFEGGAIVTDNDDLAERLRLMRNFGFAGPDMVTYIGTNGKMNEPSAAMGLTSLESRSDFVLANHRNHVSYARELADIPGLALMPYSDVELCNYQYIVVEVDETQTGLARDLLVKILEAENVLARRYFWPGCHRMEPYRTLYPDIGRYLPNTERMASRVIVLPTGMSVTPETIGRLCSVLRRAIAGANEIRERLSSDACPQVEPLRF